MRRHRFCRELFLLLLALGLNQSSWSQPEEPSKEPKKPPVRIGTDWRGNSFMVVGDGQDRALPIWIGQFEAIAIVMALEGQQPPRPMTHDLMLNMLTELGWRVSEVRITKLADTTYYGAIVLTNGQEQKEIDARSSDTVALGLRAKVPIRVEEAVFQEAMIKDEEGKPLPLDEAVRKLQEPPPDLALELIRRTLEGKMPTLELKPKDPAAEARARGEEAMTIYGELKGNTYLQAVRRFKELAGLKPDETGTAQAGAFDCEFAGRKYRFTVNVTPEPPREAVRVSMEPAEN